MGFKNCQNLEVAACVAVVRNWHATTDKPLKKLIAVGHHKCSNLLFLLDSLDLDIVVIAELLELSYADFSLVVISFRTSGTRDVFWKPTTLPFACRDSGLRFV